MTTTRAPMRGPNQIPALLDDDSTVVWRCIPGFAGYEATASGLLRNRRGTLLKTCRHRDGYAKVNLRPTGAKRRRTMHVHVLIALAFLGPRPVGYFIDHKDGDHTNDAADNLRYVTPSESNRNRKANGGSSAATGVPNVYRHGRGGYYARANANQKPHRIGRFRTIEEASAAVIGFRVALTALRTPA